MVRTYVKGQELEVMHSAVGPGRRQRRDFCQNRVVDRGIALRQNLELPQVHIREKETLQLPSFMPFSSQRSSLSNPAFPYLLARPG